MLCCTLKVGALESISPLLPALGTIRASARLGQVRLDLLPYFEHTCADTYLRKEIWAPTTGRDHHQAVGIIICPSRGLPTVLINFFSLELAQMEAHIRWLRNERAIWVCGKRRSCETTVSCERQEVE